MNERPIVRHAGAIARSDLGHRPMVPALELEVAFLIVVEIGSDAVRRNNLKWLPGGLYSPTASLHFWVW